MIHQIGQNVAMDMAPFIPLRTWCQIRSAWRMQPPSHGLLEGNWWFKEFEGQEIPVSDRASFTSHDIPWKIWKAAGWQPVIPIQIIFRHVKPDISQESQYVSLVIWISLDVLLDFLGIPLHQKRGFFVCSRCLPGCWG